MPAETMFPLAELDRILAAVRHGPAHCRRKQEGATQFPTIGLFERNANNFKGTRNTKAQKSWSSRAEPEVRIHLPPAASLVRTRFPRSGWRKLAERVQAIQGDPGQYWRRRPVQAGVPEDHGKPPHSGDRRHRRPGRQAVHAL